jgi:hypothetical protein
MSKGPAARSALERVWERLEQRGPDECWPWPGARDDNGYAHLGAYDRAHAVRLGIEAGYVPVTIRPRDGRGAA